MASAAQDWMAAGLSDHPDPLHALLAASGRHAGQGPAHSVFIPVWAGYPAVGFAARDALPALNARLRLPARHARPRIQSRLTK